MTKPKAKTDEVVQPVEPELNDPKDSRMASVPYDDGYWERYTESMSKTFTPGDPVVEAGKL